MTTKIFKVLVTTVALGALVLGTEPGMAAKGGGGGGGGGKGARRRWRRRDPTFQWCAWRQWYAWRQWCAWLSHGPVPDG